MKLDIGVPKGIVRGGGNCWHFGGCQTRGRVRSTFEESFQKLKAVVCPAFRCPVVSAESHPWLIKAGEGALGEVPLESVGLFTAVEPALKLEQDIFSVVVG